jgi:hypothetical protein
MYCGTRSIFSARSIFTSLGNRQVRQAARTSWAEPRSSPTALPAEKHSPSLEAPPLQEHPSSAGRLISEELPQPGEEGNLRPWVRAAVAERACRPGVFLPHSWPRIRSPAESRS